MKRGPQLSYSEVFSRDDAIANHATHALNRTRWIFQRFGWLSEHVIELLKSEQEPFLEGRLKV
jgi:hypothetical protein